LNNFAKGSTVNASVIEKEVYFEVSSYKTGIIGDLAAG
jgi:hypothetical protein